MTRHETIIPRPETLRIRGRYSRAESRRTDRLYQRNWLGYHTYLDMALHNLLHNLIDEDVPGAKLLVVPVQRPSDGF